ncbi:tumor necrosis factor receptor superfamily member 3 isoform X1 [Phyllopteryx taeniolatus]|uniref:tumor necrosis factor receptor superfamily member 3 isoform X1 n=1 Tax=Phyllopteryx taeniolatus TaxID=161469 RepID=UPI002AD22F52|nr:tumor necrosis factor receptor superfamily member 3 isoform X1 [Phyllopteryx taeniolatus]
MGLKVQYLVSVLLSSAQLLLTFPLTEKNHLSIRRGKECKMCPAGEFQKSCEQCAPCPAKSYTTDWNREESCHRCYGDCRPEFNQKVIEDCSSTSNLKCTCQDGFRCTAVVAYTGNCKNCVATTTVTAAAATTADEDEQTPSSSSSGSRSNSARLCSFPECETKPGNSSHANKGPQLVAVVFPMVVVVTVALTVWLCSCRRGEETCLKRAVVKLCNKGVPNVTAKEKEPNQHFLTDPCGAVHVHNAGTVIFSWLSQFTGQVGPVTETKMATKDEEEEAEDGDQAPPPSFSPSVPLSEEEMSGEAVLFPSQEEGKDWHVSKEEAEA